jgi:hypothetical protein
MLIVKKLTWYESIQFEKFAKTFKWKMLKVGWHIFLHLWKSLGLDVVILGIFISRKDERSLIKSQNISLFILIFEIISPDCEHLPQKTIIYTIKVLN